ncbi:DUF4181 domain-containing protein [Gracilibacillus oryzae]|uniref:DUF4181 domain-containing protein n=1 Tax=Gracilibacillus oryzae TaxID=1672701 RepID=A0A7C8GS34_9BACI|nr:DUF4181 domain-containing protein [Gracilibacillus oryzae]KAB8127386.1 DUF4181 domain-containing protein [Gracilibacillus oryzae]
MSTFWWKIILIIGIFILISLAYDTFMRKWLKVEKKEFFSYNFVNEKHRFVHWFVTIGGLICIFLTIPLSLGSSWFMQPWYLVIIILPIQEAARAVFERKYADNPNDFKFTISQIVFTLIWIFLLFQTRFFGLGEIKASNLPL